MGNPDEPITNYELPITALARPRVWVGGHDTEAKRKLESIIIESTRAPTGPLDTAFIAAIDEDEAMYFAAKLRSRLATGGQLWIVELNSPGMPAALAKLGYQNAGITMEAGGVMIRGFHLHSPTT